MAKKPTLEPSYKELEEEAKAKQKRHKHDVVAFNRAKKYYSILDKLYDDVTTYFFCWGMRSNGKTWSTLNKAIKVYKESGRTFCYMRRWAADLSTANMGHLLDPQPIEDIFGCHCKIVCKKRAFVLQTLDDEDKVTSEEEIGYYRSISDVAHDKSIELPHLKYIIFDEFLPLQKEIPYIDKDEVKNFINAVTTLTRVYQDIQIFFLGNTTTMASGYFNYFDIHPSKITQGTVGNVDIPYDGGVCRVKYEYCEFMPEIAAITGKYAPKAGYTITGEWDRARLMPPPMAKGQINIDQLLCSLNDTVTGRTVGLYVRTARWETLSPVAGLFRTESHARQYLVIKLDSPIHDLWHCTNTKDNLTYGLWTNFDCMANDILEQTGIDIYDQFQHNRVYAEDDDAGDRFYCAFNDYKSKSIIELLSGGEI